jgi:SAM-dependent methyltransferase
LSFADHFSTIAKQYARYRPHYPDALVDILAEHCAAHELAWDAGCGNGQLTAMLARRFTKVIGTEPSKAQLDEAEQHPRVEYMLAKAELPMLPPRSVDLAVAAQAAHWFHWTRYVSEVDRVTKPGAVVALVSYGIMQADGEAGELLARYYRDDAGPYWPPGRAHVENGYRDLVWPWTEIAAPAVDMTVEWTREEMLGYVATWSATVKMIDSVGPAPYQRLADALARVWPDGERRTIRWPLALRLAHRGS